MSWSILVVDDSAAARSQLRVAFEAKGARVIEAENGREGLWRARAERVDLIFSDIHMPVMDGLQMIQELRKHPDYATVPIFVLTSDAAGTRAAEGKKAGANAWIIKPINPELLWKAVEKALFGRQSGSHAKSPAVADDAPGNVNK
jgi:two-component system chemotaxis response regulator CheY